MSKAAEFYWDNSPRSNVATKRSASARRTRAAEKTDRRTPSWWLSALIATLIFGMLIISINFRAFTEMREEVDQNARLAGQIQNLMDDNLALQEDIHSLKTDPNVIQREARRIGIALQTQKVPVPTN